ncbi:MAG: bifunctional 4-hydroxy-2-oxoglutarate aldolase/2-dehydro-3-deoxy-phosphogluconate aldolase [Devosia nanyangense]|uniref:2-dehydro-3-deoxy-phosphogluconate aldolase n=1 Tax=Devosia nanyangense TaxID=1228055 RepID=A0A933L6L1_9HYPH|nr:bifunctional 4-hydroxy-2-oxoglutarate aldolase/2-dehydro-3-deoxy-phosphogluconate aldolase [Devosia nanyangense]
MAVDVEKRIRGAGVVPVIVIDDAADAARLAEVLVEGGLPVAEITFRTRASVRAIEVMKKIAPQMLVGAGTVIHSSSLKTARDAGADFALSPGTNRGNIVEARRLGLFFYPGVSTPSDIENAIAEGARSLKFFPAEASGGLSKLKAIASPFVAEGLRFIPTGGITTANLASYLRADLVLAVGGTWIATQAMIAEGRWEEIKANVIKVVEIVRGLESR